MADLAAIITDVRHDGRPRVVCCPSHADDTASLSVGRGEGGAILLHCHAGCSYDDIVTAAGFDRADLAATNGNGSGGRAQSIITTYPYTDQVGQLLYEVVRFAPKGFRQRKPDGRGGWDWKLGQVRRVLYRLPQLQGRKVAYVVEGEKDADRLWSLKLPGTCNSGGAGKWKAEYSEQLRASGVESVVVVADNDEPGRRHAEAVALSCSDAGIKVKLLGLPGVVEHGDVSDYLDGHSREDFVALVKVTPVWWPPLDTEPDASSVPAEAPVAAPETSAQSASEPVDLAELIKDAETFIRRYVVLTDQQATAVALWVLHTHAIEFADCTPYLNIRSATKRAGKTRLLEVSEPLVARPWLTGRTTAAALVRKVDAMHPTLLLDESDAAFRGEQEYAEALRGILNSGYRESGRATVCVGQGANINAKDFSTFCAKAIAGIGTLPDTVADRSIPILLRRRRQAEPVERWRERDGRTAARPLRDRLVQWATTASALRDARPALPDQLGDRAQDVWEPLLAIADLAGAGWPERARLAAVVLMGEPSAEDDSIGIQLLADIRQVFDDAGDPAALTSKDIRDRLCALENRPWGEWGRAKKPITGHGVARLLRDFEVSPGGNMRFGDKVAAGYRRAAFEDAWEEQPSRLSGRLSSLLGNGANESGPDPAISIPNGDLAVTKPETSCSANKDGLRYEVTNGIPKHEASPVPPVLTYPPEAQDDGYRL